ncbi:MAG: recombinase family protein [Oscillospiraceae bacterium]|nr:recombinase family protein [Oscillospiraceae bacterium]
MKAVIYARYSSEQQTENSIEGQIRECKEYSERHNMKVVTAYIDRALSAKSDDRPEFQRMIRDSAKNNFDVVLVWKLDRFARNRLDSSTYRAILKRNNVNVVSIKENISDGPEGIILEALLEGMAEYYSAELSVKIKRGHKENALKCKANGAVPPFGYNVNAGQQYEIDPLTAPIALEIFTRYADGETAVEILDDLHKRNVFAGSRRKFKHRSALYTMLKNRKYIGEYRWGEMVVPEGVPALVPQEIFDRVQLRTEQNKHKPASQKADDEYVLTSKLFCGKCGTMMVGIGGTSHTKQVYHYYKCGNNLYRKSCDKKAVKKDFIERLVVQNAQTYILRDDIIDRLADSVLELYNRENTTVPFLKKQLESIDKRINNVLNLVEEGVAIASVKERLTELESERADLEIAIAKESIAKPTLEKAQVVFWISRFKDGDVSDLEYRRAIVDILVNSVFLYDDRLVVGFNWKDGTKTISLKQCEKGVDGCDGSGSYLEQCGQSKNSIRKLFANGCCFCICGVDLKHMVRKSASRNHCKTA